jgi:glycosyltransferase involved in cell wall biosynthesis
VVQVTRILHVFGRMMHGGAELRTLDVMRHIDRDKFRFDFCTLSGLPGVLDNEIARLGGTVYPCKLDIGFGRRFRQLLRQHKYDVVHSHVQMFSGYILRLASKEKITTRVAHFHSTGDGHTDTLRRRVQRRIMKRWIDTYATDILAVGEGVMTSAWDENWRMDSRCKVVYSGIDIRGDQYTEGRSVREEFCIPRDVPLIIHVGRMDPEKNHIRLIDIFHHIRKRDNSARLLLVGKGGTQVERDVKLRIRDLGIEPYVIFAGVRDDVPRLLSEADLMIFPSLREGLPGAVLEASAVGTPVLATDLPGVVEISRQIREVNYLSLTETDELWAEVAYTILERVRSGDYRQSIRTSFKESCFSIDRCVNELCEIWCRSSFENVK